MPLSHPQAPPHSKPAKDIEDPHHYRSVPLKPQSFWYLPIACSLSTTYIVHVYTCTCSIEDAKQKAEHDRRVKQAEMKKQSVRRDVGRLRRTFLQLVQRNAQLALPLQLPANEFTMDPTLESDMKERAQQQVRGWQPLCSV